MMKRQRMTVDVDEMLMDDGESRRRQRWRKDHRRKAGSRCNGNRLENTSRNSHVHDFTITIIGVEVFTAV